MNISIKNIKEEDWRLIKAESSKNNLNIGEFLSKVLHEYKKEKENTNWNEIMHGKKFINEGDGKKIKEIMEVFRQEFEFR